LVDAESGEAVIDSTTRKPVSYVGTNPIDVPNCYNCHSNENANGAKYGKFKGELEYWKGIGASDWFSQLKATAVSILEIHDAKHGTQFLKNYNASASSNRLGRGSVLCQECHADNVIGVLNSKKVGDVVKGAKNKDAVIPPLTQAIHGNHQKLRPMPDSKGRTGSCQGCHPAHRQDRGMEGYPITEDGKNTYADSDNRDASGGCFVGRDVHSNPNADKDATTPSHLNAIGQYLSDNVVKEDGEYKGLWCTNCHNQLTRELYQRDNLENAFLQTGETLRNKSLDQIAAALGITTDALIATYIDPKVPMEGEDTDSGVTLTWAQKRTVPDIAVIAVTEKGPVVSKDADGDVNVKILSANPSDKIKGGMAVPYDAATHGRDYWLSSGEPHCADCHAAPFVEGQGGVAFPINQPGKYSLMRYSKGHSGLACQFCHESIHGLYPTTDKVDQTSFNQAAMMNPDGTHGPVKCAACHEVNSGGVPKLAEDRMMNGEKLGKNYDAAVTYMHSIAPDLGGAIPPVEQE
jgi:mono/diheme cytochrome c family protein